MNTGSVYTAALMEHNAHPEYKYEMDDATDVHRGVNPSCGDDITLSMRLEDGVIDEASFQGSGCAVSQASTDIMLDLITDKTPEEVMKLGELFLAMIRGEVTDEAELAPLGEAAQLQGISRMPARVKCAELGWRTALTMLADKCDAQAGE